MFNRRVFTGAAQRTGLTRLEPVAVAFRVFNRFFTLAERLQVEIVLVFVFILFPAQRQGSVKFYLLRLRLLDALGVLAQTLAQQLMLLMQEIRRWRSDAIGFAVLSLRQRHPRSG